MILPRDSQRFEKYNFRIPHALFMEPKPAQMRLSTNTWSAKELLAPKGVGLLITIFLLISY